MKIALLAHTVPQSGVTGVSRGISQYIYNLTVELRKTNNVQLFIRNDFKPKESWIKTISSPKFGWIPYPIFASRVFSKVDADIFHADYVTTGAALIWAKRKPSVVSIHDVIPFTYKIEELSLLDRVRVAWYKKCFAAIKNAEAIIVMSKFSKNEALRLTDLDEEKLHVVYNGIYHSVFRPLKKKNSEKIKIGYVGGLDGRKNVSLLVNAFKKISQDYDNVELHVAGTGKNLVRFRNMKIKNSFFYGFVPDNKIVQFYNMLDIFVFPSLQEGFGFGLVEAMSCGLPIIAVNVGSSPEILDKSGVLVAPNVQAVSEALMKLIDSKVLRNKLGKKALKRSKKFTWETCAKETMKVYEMILEQHSR